MTDWKRRMYAGWCLYPMSLDRTKLPPHAVGEPIFDQLIGWYIYLHDDSGHDRICAESAEACIRGAWVDYDRITLPARVALLRELAAEVGITWGRRPPDSDPNPEWRAGFVMAIDVVEHELRERADALADALVNDTP
jgi:hypothetical protein